MLAYLFSSALSVKFCIYLQKKKRLFLGFIYYFGFVFLLLGKRKGSLCLCLDNLEYFQYPALCTAVLGEILKSCK